MAEATDARAILEQNLRDAGCGPETVQCCAALSQGGETPALLRQLARHRGALLDAVHRTQKQLDCLDYLIYRLEKEERQRRNAR